MRVLLFYILASVALAQSNAALKSINMPTGGNIVYGPLSGHPTLQTAIGEMLHNVSLHYAERPQLGRLIQDRTGTVLAAFFTVTAKNENRRQIIGLVIVSVPRSGSAQAAVLTDDASRFPSSINAMLQRLQSEASAAQNNAGQQVQAQPLHTVQFPDGSGSVGLPASWQLGKAQSGDVMARGPQGERLHFGMSISALDPNNPRSRALMGPNGQAPGLMVAIPYGTDATAALKSATTQIFRKIQQPVPTINISSVHELPISGGHNYWLMGDIDLHDGKGPFALFAQEVQSQPFGSGWQMTVFQVAVPKELASEEFPTVVAMFRSYRANTQMIQGQVNANIKLGMERADQMNARVARLEDQSERDTAAFSNILLDQSVVRDTQRNAHGTISDGYADALVRSNPDRFQYVPSDQYVKGIDY